MRGRPFGWWKFAERAGLLSPAAGGGGGDAIAWGTEWRTATGTTEAAMRDTSNANGGFDEYNGTLGNGAAEIVAPTGLGLLTRGNLLRITANGSANLTVTKNNVIAESTTFWGRCYILNALADGNYYSFAHPISYGGIGLDHPIQFSWAVNISSVFGQDRRVIGFKTNYDDAGDATAYPYTQWTPHPDSDARPYGFGTTEWALCEWQILYLTATTYELNVWISSVDGNGAITSEDVWTNTTFQRQDGNGTAAQGLAALQGTSVDFGLSTAGDGPEAAVKLILGNESSGTPATGDNIYLASFAMSTTGRIRDTDLGLG